MTIHHRLEIVGTLSSLKGNEPYFEPLKPSRSKL
jgi:hypothetical protein